MIKTLLSITIWLRKYQGREGNYYTISRALTILIVFIYAWTYCIGYWLGKLLKFDNNFITQSPILLFVLILLAQILFQVLVFKLKNEKIYLGYRRYQSILNTGGILYILVFIQLLIMSLSLQIVI